MSSEELNLLRKKLAKNIGYGDLGRNAFGPSMCSLIQFIVAFTQFSTCMAYFIFIGNTVYMIFPLTIIMEPTPINHTVNSVSSVQPNMAFGVPMLQLENIGKLTSPHLNDESHTNFRAHSFVKRNVELYGHAPLYVSTRSESSVESAILPQVGVDNSNVKMHIPGLDSSVQQSLRSQSADLDLETDMVLSSTATPANGTMSSVTAASANGTTKSHTENSTATPESSNETTTTPMSSITLGPALSWLTISTAPRLLLLILFPLPFFLLTSQIRSLRVLSPFSIIATVSLVGGASAVFAFIISGTVDYF